LVSAQYELDILNNLVSSLRSKLGILSATEMSLINMNKSRLSRSHKGVFALNTVIIGFYW